MRTFHYHLKSFDSIILIFGICVKINANNGCLLKNSRIVNYCRYFLVLSLSSGTIVIEC